MSPPSFFASWQRVVMAENEAWCDLIAALDIEKDALKSQDVTKITESTTRKGAAIDGLRRAIAERRRMYAEAVPVTLYRTVPDLGAVLDCATPEERQELARWQEKFAAYAREVERKNRENAAMIRASLAVVTDALTFLARITGLQPGYNEEGHIAAQPLQGKILSERG